MSPSVVVLVTLLALLAVGVVALERSGDGPKELALVATLGAAAAAGRVLFAAIPGVQPVTVTCLVAGAALGPRAGLAVGPVAGLISNSFLGQGPWTPAQMALWGLAGLSGAALGPLCRRRWGLAVVGFGWGFVFGWGMNVWFLASFGPRLNPAGILLAGAQSFPFDLSHALGNTVMALVAGPALVRLLARYAARVRTEVVSGAPPAPARDPSAPSAPARHASAPPR